MKKSIISLSIVILILTLTPVLKVMANDIESDSLIYGTSYKNNIISDTYLNDATLKLNIVTYTDNVFTFQMEFNSSKSTEMIEADFIVYDDQTAIYFLPVNSDRLNNIYFETFYVEYVTNNNLNMEHTSQYGKVIRIAFNINDELYYFEQDGNEIFNEMTNMDYLSKATKGVPEGFRTWYIKYISSNFEEKPMTIFQSFSLVQTCIIGPSLCLAGEGSNPPTFYGMIPSVIKDNYTFFIEEGSDIDNINGLLIYHYTYKYPFLNDEYNKSYIVNYLIADYMYSEARRSYYTGGEADLTIKFIERGRLLFDKTNNDISPYYSNSAPNMIINNVTLEIRSVTEGIGLKETTYIGNASNSWLSGSDIRYLVKYIPYVGDVSDTIINIISEQKEFSMNIDNVSTFDSFYSQQQASGYISNGMVFQSTDYWLENNNEYFKIIVNLTDFEGNSDDLVNHGYLYYYIYVEMGADPFAGYITPIEIYNFGFHVDTK